MPRRSVLPAAQAAALRALPTTVEDVGHAVFAMGEPIRERLRAFFGSSP